MIHGGEPRASPRWSRWSIGPLSIKPVLRDTRKIDGGAGQGSRLHSSTGTAISRPPGEISTVGQYVSRRFLSSSFPTLATLRRRPFVGSPRRHSSSPAGAAIQLSRGWNSGFRRAKIAARSAPTEPALAVSKCWERGRIRWMEREREKTFDTRRGRPMKRGSTVSRGCFAYPWRWIR